MFKSLKLITENCEVIEFMRSDIVLFETSTIEEHYQCSANSIRKLESVKGFTLIVKDGSGVVLGCESTSCNGSRILECDITSIEILHDDDTIESITVKWKKNDMYTHSGQGSSMNVYMYEGCLSFWSETKGYKSFARKSASESNSW